MTIRAVLLAMLRRWYVTLVVAALAALTLVLMYNDGGIYTSRTVVSFIGPYNSTISYGNTASDQDLIAFAGTIASGINNGKPVERYSDDSAPYYGAGAREGVLVGVTASGNQWAASFPRADIEIQIVGRTEEWVADKQAELVDKVLATTEAQQDALGGSSQERIKAQVVPLTLVIQHVVPGRTGLIAAVGAMMAAALLIAAWGSVRVDRLIRRRGVRRRSIQHSPIRRLEESIP